MSLDKRTFKGSAWKQIVPLGAALALAGLFLWRSGLYVSFHINGWGYSELSVVVVLLLFSGANVAAPASLMLDERGFTWKSWRYTAQFDWSDLEKFMVGPGSRPKIAFNFKPGQVPTQRGATSANRAINGYDRSMANVWAPSTEDLVNLLNEYLAQSCRADDGV